jgi:lambda family phage portal protein
MMSAKILAGMASNYIGGLMYPNGAYQGASSTRQALKAWNTSRASADVDTLSNLDVLRSRSRDLVRNVPTATAAVNKKTINVVGTGLRWKPRLNAERLGISVELARAKERELGYWFHVWAKSKNSDAARTNNFYQNQALVYRSQIESGDIFALLPFIDRPTSFLDVAIKLVESDLCRNPSTAIPTLDLAGGIEQDEWGAAIAYWFAKNHAQDIELVTEDDMIRVPAYGEQTGRPMVLHVFGQDRPNQRRGIPLLAPVIEPLKNLGRYQDAELMAAVIAGMFTVFIKTATGAPSGGGNVPDSAKVGTGPNPVERDAGDYEMSYGGVVDLGQDEEIQTANPGRPNPNFEGFTGAILKEIGGALGIGAEMIQGMYTSSYTAARAAFLDAYRGFRVDIANLETDFCEPVKNTVYLNAVLRGAIDLPGYLRDVQTRELWEEGIWVGMAHGQLDPLKETAAYKMKVDERFTSRRVAAQKLEGEDLEQVIQEQAEEQGWEREAGLQTIEGTAPTTTTTGTGTDTGTDTSIEEGSEESEMVADGFMTEEEITKAKATADTYGILARAGATTPQTADEEYFRSLFKLPQASAEVLELWDSSGGYRRPVTLAKEEALTAEGVEGGGVEDAPVQTDGAGLETDIDTEGGENA